jgi:predicted O-linked N-acetylglucosamine transferase (SPINDLY family)
LAFLLEEVQMDSAGQPAQLCYDSNNEQLANSAVVNPENQRLGSLAIEDGNLQMAFFKGELPQFIIDANDAVKAGNIEEAAKILNKDAIEVFREKIEQDGCRTVVMLALAKLLFDADQLPEAEQWYEKILEREPHAFVYNAIADICLAQGRISETAQYRKKAVETDPDNQAYWLDFAVSMIQTGKRNEGIELLRKRVEMAPPDDNAAGSILLWQTHYLPGTTPEMFFEDYKKWGRTYFPMSMAKTSHSNDPDPDRGLRIGYISPDFRSNVVSKSFEPFLDGHDRRDFDIYGYGNIAKPDKVTKRFEEKFDHYRNIHGMSFREAAQLVEKDQIDILIEIGGHCRDNCLEVLAFKPAPVQVDYGGIDTSGMEQIDYRLTDRIMTPARMEGFYVEESTCLPGGIFSYRPPRRSPLVGHLPAKKNGYITFASFNNSVKINSYSIELWAKILNADEKSRFLLKFLGGSDRGLQEYYLSEFERFGVCRERVDFYDMFGSHFVYMELYNKVDIMLDTCPFNGCMTTLEGLWMGVPTISLVGEKMLYSRAGLSILSRVGLEIFTASTPDEYVAKANAFSKELDNLEKIRASLRQMMLDSNLCKPKRFTDEIEAAYRKMWHRWCKKQNANATD